MSIVPRNQPDHGHGFQWLLLGDSPDYDKPDTHVVGVFPNKPFADSHLKKVREWADKLDAQLHQHPVIFNPYDPLWCSSRPSPDYYLVKVPGCSIVTLETMDRVAEEELIVYCSRCTKPSGDKFPEGSQRYVRTFVVGEYGMPDAAADFVCSKCKWEDKLVAEKKKYDQRNNR